MQKSIINSFTGYIEGYYGKLLTWSQRRKIVNKLNKTKMSFYFYAPKTDLFHRQNWRKSYPKNWLKSFKNFTNYSHSKDIRIIAGISPGLDISFKKNKIKQDVKYLTKKAQALLDSGADEIAILFDDVPKNTSLLDLETDGDFHALFINKLGEILNKDIFVVPKIYAYELEYLDPYYIEKFIKRLKTNHVIFFCGQKIIARSKRDLFFKPTIKNKVIIWDNIYANDYCPKKLLIGPWKNRNNIKDIMINPTGLIETDLLILDLVSMVQSKVEINLVWSNILKKYKIPQEINFFKKLLDPYHIYDESFNLKSKNINKIIFSIDKLLWEWNSPLSREWYPYLYNLKHDLLISCKKTKKQVIIKTQTIPFASYILKNLSG